MCAKYLMTTIIMKTGLEKMEGGVWKFVSAWYPCENTKFLPHEIMVKVCSSKLYQCRISPALSQLHPGITFLTKY